MFFVLPVMGASTSIIVFSCRNNFAPSSIILRATSSVTRPSAIKCVLRISTRGFPRESNTSYALKRVFGGHGMSIIFQIKSFYSFSSKHFYFSSHDQNLLEILHYL